jgi:hypothetical protein
MTEIKSAMPELIALAEASRPDWDADELRGALVGAAERGWPWPRALVATATLLADPDGMPRDLRARTSDPLHPAAPEPGDPQARAAIIAEAHRVAEAIRADRADSLAAEAARALAEAAALAAGDTQ